MELWVAGCVEPDLPEAGLSVKPAGAWLRSISIALLLGVLALAVLTARAVIDGESELRQSDEAFDRGDLRAATDHARRAAVLYAPGAPHVPAAYERLIAIASGAESAGQRAQAESAWRAVRGAALETRHVFIPHARELERANENLARLAASSGQEPPAAADAARVIERARRELDRDHAPKAGWIFVLLAGFVLAVSGLILTALRGVAPDGRLALGQARVALVLAVLGAACWTLAVLKA
jgi:hypothetical protein